MKTLLISFLLPFSVFAGTFNSNTGAFFSANTVNVRVASNTDCTQAGTSKDELLQMINPAINDYWNTVSTSRLKLANGGLYETNDNNFNDGRLCNVDTDDTCSDNGSIIPKVSEIVITCNDDVTFNFSGTKAAEVFAIALPNHISGSHLIGSVIIINNTATSPFASKNFEEKTWIIAHEIGHAIGLGHTTRDENLMFWTPTPDRFALGPDDAMAMTYLYPQKFDGCGIINSVQDVNGGGSNLFGVLLASFLLLLTFLIFIKKVFFKGQKTIFHNGLSGPSC